MAPVAQLGAGNVTTASSGSTPTSLTASKPSNTSDGDLLIAAYFNRTAANTFTTPSGWTAYQTNVVNGSFGLWGKPIPSAAAEVATTYAFGATSGNRSLLVVFRVTAALLAAALDAAGASSPSTGSPSTVDPAVTAVTASGLLVAVNTNNTTTATVSNYTAPTGMTEVSQINCTTGAATSCMEIAVQALTASGSTGTRTANISPAAANSAGFMVTIAPMPPAPPIRTVSQQSVNRASLY